MVLESRRISAELQIIIQNKKHETYSFKKNIKISMSRVGEMQVSFYWQIKRSQFEGVNVHINTKKNKKGIHGYPLKLYPLRVDEKRPYPYLKDWKMR